jgi:hypothetical protein
MESTAFFSLPFQLVFSVSITGYSLYGVDLTPSKQLTL